MREHAFRILGIAPTNDPRLIREAFVRLAQIYHPDRFAGMPDGVRAEAERRMKEATAAYELLRARPQPAAAAETPADYQDAWERARGFREEVRRRHEEDEQTRARYRRWAELERRALERAERDARLAAEAAVAEGYRVAGDPEPHDDTPDAKPHRSELLIRLDAAKGTGPTASPPAVRR